jgi:hypothetical protein
VAARLLATPARAAVPEADGRAASAASARRLVLVGNRHGDSPIEVVDPTRHTLDEAIRDVQVDLKKFV